MAQQPGEATQLLMHKATLIDILCFEPDHVRQHAHSRLLLSPNAYNAVGDRKTRREQVTHLLDNVIEAGDDKAKGLLELLKEDDMQNTYPRLDFLLRELPPTSTGLSRNNEEAPGAKEIVPRKRKADSNIVTEKQLMEVAKRIGKTWRKIGISLGITEVKLQQIEAENPLDHVDKVYQMLFFWRKSQRNDATAAYLHSMLTKLDKDLIPDGIDFLVPEED